MPDICVVGAGFVGLSFGIAAARCGFDVRVTDRKPAPGVPDAPTANVIAVNPVSAGFLSELCAWDRIDPAFRTPFTGMSVVDATGTGAIRFTAEDAGLPELGHIVDQRALLAALADAAQELSSLEVCWEATSDIAPGEVPLLVGADGTHSRIRERSGLRKLGYSYHQTATVCVGRLSTGHDRQARQWFHETGPVALLPLSDAGLVAVIWSHFEDLTRLTDTEFQDRLTEAVELPAGDILLEGPRFSFPLMQQQSLQYVAEGVALLGDAAHTIHPLAGQGANLGFADARCLVTELAGARIEGLSPGNLAVLKRYERARQPHNHAAAVAMEGFHRLFTSGSPLLAWLRSTGLRLVDRQASLKQIAINVASGRV